MHAFSQGRTRVYLGGHFLAFLGVSLCVETSGRAGRVLPATRALKYRFHIDSAGEKEGGGSCIIWYFVEEKEQTMRTVS